MVVGLIRAILYIIPCQFWALYVLFLQSGCQLRVNNRLKISMESIIDLMSVRSQL